MCECHKSANAASGESAIQVIEEIEGLSRKKKANALSLRAAIELIILLVRVVVVICQGVHF